AESGKSITQQAMGDAPIKFEVRYNNVPQTITQDPGLFGDLRIDPPNQGDEVTFYMTNMSPNKIGAVVKVNGESTLSQETAEDAACQKWVLTPSKLYALRGFYVTGESKLTPFKVLSDDESAARMAEWSGSHARAGYIDVTVFTEGIALEATSDDDPNQTTGRAL